MVKTVFRKFNGQKKFELIEKLNLHAMEQQITLATKNLKGNLKAFNTTNINATTMKNIAMQRQMYA